MLVAAAQPLLLLAEGHHLGAELLVRQPPHEPPLHVLGLDVGLDVLPADGGQVQSSLLDRAEPSAVTPSITR